MDGKRFLEVLEHAIIIDDDTRCLALGSAIGELIEALPDLRI
jgi:hypothetical protein